MKDPVFAFHVGGPQAGCVAAVDKSRRAVAYPVLEEPAIDPDWLDHLGQEEVLFKSVEYRIEVISYDPDFIGPLPNCSWPVYGLKQYVEGVGLVSRVMRRVCWAFYVCTSGD